MVRDFILMTDDSCDLPDSYFSEHHIPYISLSFLLDDTLYTREDMEIKEFYDSMRNGTMPSTTQINRQEFLDHFTPFLEQGKDIIYLAFSSGLSGTCLNGQGAAEDLRETYPDRKIIVIDTLCASMGQGLLVELCRQKRDGGASLEEIQEYAEMLVPRIVHTFTVDDLMHLHRGGRVSKTAAVAGSLLGIKPYLAVNEEGCLVAAGKVRGRKAALDKIVDEMKTLVGDTSNEMFMVSHGDCLEDAEYVAEQAKKIFHIDNIMINEIGPVIGTHAGPGTVALFMVGKQRMR